MNTVPAELPPADQLIEEARQVLAAGGSPDDARDALDRYAPAIDEYAEARTAAAWLGISAATLYRERSRTRAGGEAAWPDPDVTAGRSGLWSFRTLVLHRAAMPGKGSAGRGRPRRSQP